MSKFLLQFLFPKLYEQITIDHFLMCKLKIDQNFSYVGLNFNPKFKALRSFGYVYSIIKEILSPTSLLMKRPSFGTYIHIMTSKVQLLWYWSLSFAISIFAIFIHVIKVRKIKYDSSFRHWFFFFSIWHWQTVVLTYYLALHCIWQHLLCLGGPLAPFS